jgi:pathogenesis-related protein 1
MKSSHALCLFALGSLFLAASTACGPDEPDASSSGGGGEGGEGGAASASASTSGGGDGEPPEMNGMTAAQNAARAAVSPPASTPIPPLVWSPEVAAAAQAHAAACVFEHSSSPYGENIYATSGNGTPAAVVESWVSEESDYDYASNSCSGTCGHYTQVVWAKSLSLGCGVQDCTKNSPLGGGDWQFWVCNYDPPGNFNGEKPY